MAKQIDFATEIAGRPTYFIEKIWQCLLRDSVAMNSAEFASKKKKCFPIIGNPKIGDYSQKKHTIRRDSENEITANTAIELCNDDFVFTPKLTCEGTQLIVINPKNKGITVDEKPLLSNDIERLISNDGFDSEIDFWSWFREPYKGKIIHWTATRY